MHQLLQHGPPGFMPVQQLAGKRNGPGAEAIWQHTDHRITWSSEKILKRLHTSTR